MNSCQLRTKRSQQLFGISAKNNLRRVFVNLEETKDPLETKIKAVAKAKMCEEEDDKFALHIKKQNEILNNPLVDKFSTHIIIDDKEKDKEKEKPIVKLKYKFNDERDTKSEYNALGSGVKHKDSKKKKNTFKYNNINKKADDIFFEMFKTFAGPQKNKKRVKKEAELEKSVRLTSCKSAYGNLLFLKSTLHFLNKKLLKHLVPQNNILYNN